jgi:hypothetical protein
VQLRHGRRHREQYAHQRDEYAEVDRGTDADRGKIVGRMATRHDRVDDRIRHDGELRDQHRPREVVDRLDELEPHGRRCGAEVDPWGTGNGLRPTKGQA